MASGAYDYNDDPKHMVFTLARYKFVARMLAGKEKVLEIGCAEGWKSRIVRQAVGSLTAIDADADLIARAKADNPRKWNIEFECRNALKHSYGDFDAVYCIDFLEHISKDDEQALLNRMRCAAPVSIIGIPSLESQRYSNRPEHINCKTGEELRLTCQKHWRQVFMFSMNDEVLHTGFFPMSHYLFALCVA